MIIQYVQNYIRALPYTTTTTQFSQPTEAVCWYDPATPNVDDQQIKRILKKNNFYEQLKNK